jgi:ABC-type nitrate/sulfonate/bicarbonate transport system permease component
MLKKIFRPFEPLNPSTEWGLRLFWLGFVLLLWFVGTSGEKHMLPTPGQVWQGFSDLYTEGLIVHIGSSLWLCAKATVISLLATLLLVYLSPIPFIQPISLFVSKLRYLPLTGITFYLAMMFQSAGSMQVAVLVIFMSTYFVTSMLSVIKDIPLEEFEHARSLKCSRWEIVWEVVVKGRLDYVLDTLRQNLAIVWMMLVTVESILVASGGLGVLIKNSDKFMNHGRIFALQIVILLLGLLIDVTLTYIRKTLFRYSQI